MAENPTSRREAPPTARYFTAGLAKPVLVGGFGLEGLDFKLGRSFHRLFLVTHSKRIFPPM